MLYDIQLTDHPKDGDSHSENLVLNKPNDGLWLASGGGSHITDTGGGSDHSKWNWDKGHSTVTLYELGYPEQEPLGEPKVVLSDVARFPLNVNDSGSGKQLFGGNLIRKGDINWKCVNVR